MKNVIQITDKILGVIVPESAFDFNLCNSNIIDYWKDFEGGRSGEIELPEGTTYKDWKIHGTCTLQAFDFDFEVDESWVEKKKFNKGVFIEDTYLYRDYLSSNENMCFVGLPEYECRVKSFKSKIQKAIQDEGMFFVNPYGEKEPELSDPNPHSQYYAGQLYEQERWQSSESKTVKKLLIIEKN
jgi:hypothetical protein